MSKNPTGLLGPGARKRAISPAMKPTMNDPKNTHSSLPLGLTPTSCFFLVRQTAVRRHGIDRAWQHLPEFGEEAIARDTRTLRDGVKRIGADCLFEILRRYGLIGAGADP